MSSVTNHPTQVLNEDMWMYISTFLSLKDRSRLAVADSHFNRMMNFTKVKRGCFAATTIPTFMAHVNGNFLKKYFQFLNVEHIRACNYAALTREELKEMTTDHQSPVLQTALFLHSHEAMRQIAQKLDSDKSEESPENPRVSIWNAQRTYLHLVIWSGWDRLLHVFDLFTANSVSCFSQKMAQMQVAMVAWQNATTNPATEAQFDKLKHDQRIGQLWHLDLYRLAMNHPAELENTATMIWNKYNVANLDCMSTVCNSPGNMYKYMPIGFFRGFCNAIASKTTDFGRFKFWYLTDEHLKSWNAAFQNRRVEWIDVGLLNDVKPETLKEFIAIINNLDPTSHLRVEWMGDQGLHFPQAGETELIFKENKTQIESRNSSWKWSIVE